MLQIPTSELRGKIPKIRRQVEFGKEKIAVTYYSEIIGFLLSIPAADAIASIKNTEEMTLTNFRDNLTRSWEKLQYDLDCIYILNRSRKIMAFVSPRIYSISEVIS